MTEEYRKQVIQKAILQLTDHFRMAAEQYFRPLSEKALTDAEYGEISLSASVNNLRYVIYTMVAKDQREWIIDEIAKNMKIEPKVMSDEDIAKEEAEKERKLQAYKDKEAELEYVTKVKQQIEDNLYKPGNSQKECTCLPKLNTRGFLADEQFCTCKLRDEVIIWQ